MDYRRIVNQVVVAVAVAVERTKETIMRHPLGRLGSALALGLLAAPVCAGPCAVFTERVISTNAAGARSVYATDVDGDGDADVLSASAYDDKIAWYESDGGSPPGFTERVISTAAAGARPVYATDVDVRDSRSG
jgi:hypothetical protein